LVLPEGASAEAGPSVCGVRPERERKTTGYAPFELRWHHSPITSYSNGAVFLLFLRLNKYFKLVCIR